MLDFLLKSDFFVAPASSQFHSAFEGGLCYHTLKVYNRFRKAVINEYGDNYLDKVSEETIAICALLHDLCKIDTFKVDTRNKKVDALELLYEKIAKYLEVERNEIEIADIILCDCQNANYMANKKYIVGQCQDNLQGAYTSLIAFLETEKENDQKGHEPVY